MEFERLSERYRGDAARQYNVEREGGRKWDREQAALARLMDQVPDGLAVLDVPVGTGRLFEFYHRHRHRATGVDISPDMLEEASARAKGLGLEVQLRTGDIRRLPFPDRSFDLVACIRFLNWVDEAGFRASLSELVRVSRDRLLVGIRHITPLGDLRPIPSDLVRLARRSLGHPQQRARRSGLVYHQKSQIHDVFASLKLQIDASAVVEKRSDGTDYCFYLLRKGDRE